MIRAMNQRKVSDVCALGWDYVERDKTVDKASCARGFIFTCCVHLRYVLIHMQTITFGMEEQLHSIQMDFEPFTNHSNLGGFCKV